MRQPLHIDYLVKGLKPLPFGELRLIVRPTSMSGICAQPCAIASYFYVTLGIVRLLTIVS
jgi:hypothetical protein